MLTIEPAKGTTVAMLSQRLHPADAAELVAAGAPPLPALMVGVDMQELRWRGELVCAFGARDFPGRPGCGIPWMLCTELVDQVPRRAMARVSLQVMASWRARYSALYNMVHTENQRAVRFVQWLGFEVSSQPCGPGDAFRIFEWRRTHV